VLNYTFLLQQRSGTRITGLVPLFLSFFTPERCAKLRVLRAFVVQKRISTTKTQRTQRKFTTKVQINKKQRKKTTNNEHNTTLPHCWRRKM